MKLLFIPKKEKKDCYQWLKGDPTGAYLEVRGVVVQDLELPNTATSYNFTLDRGSQVLLTLVAYDSSSTAMFRCAQMSRKSCVLPP